MNKSRIKKPAISRQHQLAEFHEALRLQLRVFSILNKMVFHAEQLQEEQEKQKIAPDAGLAE